MRFFLLITLAIPFMYSCGGSSQVFSSTERACTFLPPDIEAYVDMYIDEIDGESTKFNLMDSAIVDEGKHMISLRLEYEPAAGSSLVVGGLANLLLRAAANKTFTSELEINVSADQEYRFVVVDAKNGFTISMKNETTGKIEEEFEFELKDGHFTRVFAMN